MCINLINIILIYRKFEFNTLFTCASSVVVTVFLTPLTICVVVDLFTYPLWPPPENEFDENENDDAPDPKLLEKKGSLSKRERPAPNGLAPNGLAPNGGIPNGDWPKPVSNALIKMKRVNLRGKSVWWS